MMPIVKPAMAMPVTMVTIIEVCRGRKPNNDMRRFPTLVPILSPINAIAPPMMTKMSIIRSPSSMPRPPFAIRNFLYT